MTITSVANRGNCSVLVSCRQKKVRRRRKRQGKGIARVKLYSGFTTRYKRIRRGFDVIIECTGI